MKSSVGSYEDMKNLFKEKKVNKEYDLSIWICFSWLIGMFFGFVFGYNNKFNNFMLYAIFTLVMLIILIALKYGKVKA